ncbi:hypothetical protein ACLBWH_09540 [Sphingomonas sp. M6A6_1c]
MARLKLFVGVGVALAGVAGYWLSRPSPALLTSPDKVAIVPGAIRHTTEEGLARPETVKMRGSGPDNEQDFREASRSRISQQILPLLNRTGTEGRIIHDRLVTERRDDIWASKAEGNIHTAYDRLKAVGEAGRPVDIQCAATLCEVSGDLEDRPGGKGSDAMASVQAFELIRAMAADGYDWQTTIIGKGFDGRQMFVTYFNRASPRNLKIAPSHS